MAVIYCPNSTAAKAQCVICHKLRRFTFLAAGFKSMSGQQHFACNSHSRNLSTLITGWADFLASQRRLWLDIQEVRDGGHESPLY